MICSRDERWQVPPLQRTNFSRHYRRDWNPRSERNHSSGQRLLECFVKPLRQWTTRAGTTRCVPVSTYTISTSDTLVRMDETPRPKASPEQAKHMLKELKALAEGGHIKMTEFTLVRDSDKTDELIPSEPLSD